MLKTIVLLERSTLKRLKLGDNKVNKFGISGDIEHIKKSEKMSKSQNLAKSEKKLSKSENSTNFNIMEAEQNF